MRLVGFRHKGLRRLYADDNVKGLSVAIIDKLRKLLFVLETAQDIAQLRRFPGWKLHPLQGFERFLEPNRYRKLVTDLPL